MHSQKFFFQCLLFLMMNIFVVQSGVCGQKTGSPVKKKLSKGKIYQIGSGDILNIITWKEEDFSRDEVLVRIDGKISFPLLNDLQAAGRTPLELKNEIEVGLKKFIDAPIVTVTVKVASSQKFYILGEVMRTGEYNLFKDLTILQAFAIAGGFTEWAAKDEIILYRTEDNKDKIIRVDYKDILQGEGFHHNIPIKANDTIIVP